MGKMYSSDEIVKFGIQIEKNGRDFYDLASKTVKAEKLRQVFEYISNDEQLHIAIFEGIVSKIDTNPRTAGNYPTEYVDYVNALVEENVFTKNKQGSEVARTIRNDKQALEIALGFEKDSILFYNEIKKVMGAGVHKDIDKLISEEQDHFKRLSDVMKGFNKFGVGVNRDSGARPY
ncbi:MAG: ferritin family protein [Endomicrobiales bacterium]|jgi:rubrerythrin